MPHKRLIAWCYLGCVADYLTTFAFVRSGLGRELNPVTVFFIGVLGFAGALCFLTVMRLAIVWTFTRFQKQAKKPHELRVLYAGFVVLLFAGWGPALNNAYLMWKGVR
jgi:hypothetical protein